MSDQDNTNADCIGPEEPDLAEPDKYGNYYMYRDEYLAALRKQSGTDEVADVQ